MRRAPEESQNRGPPARGGIARWAASLAPIVVFVTLRLAILLTSIDRVSFVGEAEVAIAQMALDAARPEGIGPLRDYLSVDFHFGTLVCAALFVPFAAVFGPTWFALKLMALALALAGQIVWMAALFRVAGRQAALWMGWLLACAPPLLLTSHLTMWGNHAESHVLLGAMVFVLAGLDGRTRLGGPLLLGTLATFAISFNRLNAPFAALTVLLTLPVLGRERGRAFWSSVLALGAGAGLGFGPLLWQRSFGGDPSTVYLQGPAQLFAGAWDRLPQMFDTWLRLPLLSPQLPWTTHTDHGFGALIHGAVWSAALVALALCVRRLRPFDARASAALVLAVFPFLFFVVLHAVHLPWNNPEAERYVATPRYTLSLYLGLFAGLSVLTAAPGRIRVVATGLAVLIAGTGLADDTRLGTWGGPWTGHSTRALEFAKKGIFSTNRVNERGIAGLIGAEERREKPPIPLTRGARWMVERRLVPFYGDVLDMPDPKASDALIEERMAAARAGRSPEDDAAQFEAGLQWGARILRGEAGEEGM